MTHLKTFILSLAVASCTASVLAGPLATDPNSLGSGTWSGTSLNYQGYLDPPFNTLPTELKGRVEWAVFAPGTFPAGFTAFDNSGPFTPEPGDYVYTYQIYETGALAVSFMGVTLQTTADSIGYFTGNDGNGLVDGAAPIFSFIDSMVNFQSQWYFNEDGVVISPGNPGGTSTGLWFSSPYGPQLLDGNAIDGGSSAVIIPLPTPLPPNAPEPGTIVLASFGLVALGVQLLRRRMRRACV